MPQQAGAKINRDFIREAYFQESITYTRGVVVVWDESTQSYVKLPSMLGQKAAGIVPECDFEGPGWFEVQILGKAVCIGNEAIGLGSYVSVGATTGYLRQAFAGEPIIGRAVSACVGQGYEFEVELLIGQIAPPKIQEIAAATGTVDDDADVVKVNYTTTGAVTDITIPSDRILIAGQKISFIDEDGNAGTNNITITTEGSETINGSATYVMDADHEAVTLISDGSNLFVLSGYAE